MERTPPATGESNASVQGLIVNADDWGRDRLTTERTLDCLQCGEVSSVSAMVFMEDSASAAALAAEHDVDAGLHLNLTTAFSLPHIPGALRDHQQRLARWLGGRRLASVIYHPILGSSFEYVVKAQIDEYARLYGNAPSRIDGHHHMHLCRNVMSQKLLPEGTIIRRNFSFWPGEKSVLNRFYRGWQDKHLAKRHRMSDYFFSLPPINVPGRLERMGQLAASFCVEVETHPVDPQEYRFLTAGKLRRQAGNVEIARGYRLRCR